MDNNQADVLLQGLYEVASRPLSDSAVEQAIMSFTDYLACAYLGHRMLSSEVASYVDSLLGDRGRARVIGMNDFAPAQSAALLNGMQAHAAELDDGHRYGMIHPGVPVFSALLAMASYREMSGAQFLRGVVLGYEAGVRVALAVQPDHKLKGFHATGTCGAIGAAIGIAFALGYDEAQMRATLSAAATDAAGLLEVIGDGSTLKPYNAGRAAAAAVNSALMGQAGFVGPSDVLGGPRGFFKVAGDRIDFDALSEGCGERYAIETVYRKPYAACRHCHAPIEAALSAWAGGTCALEDIASVEVETYGLAVSGHDHIDIPSASAAKMSIPYSVAVALVYGAAGYQQFERTCLDDSRVQDLTKKVSVRESTELSSLAPAKRVAIVRIKTPGSDLAARVEYPKGEPENPLMPEELDDKFLSLLSAAGEDDSYARELLELAKRADEAFPSLLEIMH